MPNRNEERAAVTQTAILNAAETAFLEKGARGASLSAIAKLAGVNQSLLSHHFGSKAGLWEATCARLNQRYFEQQFSDLQEAVTPDKGLLRGAISSLFRFLKQTPGAVRLQAWLFLDGKGQPPPDAQEMVQLGFERLRQAQANGQIRPDIPAEFIWANFVGMAYHWFQLRDEYQETFQAAVGSDVDLDEAYLESLQKIFFEGIGTQP